MHLDESGRRPAAEAPGKQGALRALALVALLLIAAAGGLHWIGSTDTDLPPLPELLGDARDVCLPAARGEPGGWSAAWHDPVPGLRTWKLTWLALTGQWDARGLAIAALALQVAALGALLGALARGLRPMAWGIVALAATAATAAPALAALRPAGAAAGATGLVLLSTLHLALTVGGRRPWTRWLGMLFGAVNVWWTAAGWVSAAVLAVWGLVEARRAPGGGRKRWRLIAPNLALSAAGLLLAVLRRQGSGGDGWLPVGLGPAGGWHVVGAAVTLLAWLPAAICVYRWWRGRTVVPAPSLLVVLAVWALGLAAGYAVGHDSVPAEVIFAGLAINAACVFVLPGRTPSERTRNFTLAVAWCVVVLRPLPGGPPQLAGPGADEPLTEALRHAASDGDTTALRATGMLTGSQCDQLAALLPRPELRRILPVSIRAPLALAPEATTEHGAFRPEGAPAMSGRGALPAFGTWTPEGGGATGEFAGAPVTTGFPLLQVRVGGELQPPATVLALRTADGVEWPPLDRARSANDRWRRVNFAVPRGPFRLVARDASPTQWLAFTAPVEVSRASWLAGKAPRVWPWLLAAGLACGAAAGALGAWRPFLQRGGFLAGAPGEPLLAWRAVPWLLLAAYAAFCSQHLDTTAGPNDSGGYLNSAKLLVQGHLTAAPRLLFGPAAGETDITPYLPITFVQTKGDRMAPTYPVGLPLLIRAVAEFTSLEHAVAATLFVHLLLGVVFTWLLARAFGLGEGWAGLAAGMVGLSPVYLHQALQPQSDGPALVWVTAAVYWAWTSRDRPWRAGLAGVATALAVLIRPSDLLCVLPIAICLSGAWRRTALWVLGGLPGAVWLLWYQHELYGHWYTTGYGDVPWFFGVQYVAPTLRSYAIWLTAAFTPVVWLGWAGPFLRAVGGRARLVLASWAGVFLTFYALYWCTWDRWFNMRFVLPAMPAVLVLAVLALRHFLARWDIAWFSREAGVRGLVASAVLVVAAAGWQVAAAWERHALFWVDSNRGHAVAVLWARDHLPADAVVFAKHATGSLWYYTDLQFVRSDHEAVRRSPEFFARVVATGRPVCALNYYWETREIDAHGRGTGRPDLPGEWERLATIWQGDVVAWQRHPPATAAGKGSDRGSPHTR